MAEDPQSLHMEDDEARRLAEQEDEPENKQGADKRAPDREQGESVPDGANDAASGAGASGAGGDAGGSPSQGGAGDGGGGASYGGGTGNP